MRPLDPRLPPSTTGSDRRRDVRVALDLPVATIVRGRTKPFRLVDLSCTGAQIERGPDSLPPPLVHTIELDLGGDYPLRLLVRTVWTDDKRHAVAFLALDDVDRLTMAEVIDHLLHRRPHPHPEQPEHSQVRRRAELLSA